MKGPSLLQNSSLWSNIHHLLQELPGQAVAMDEEDLEEALEAAALDELEEELE